MLRERKHCFRKTLQRYGYFLKYPNFPQEKCFFVFAFMTSLRKCLNKFGILPAY